MNPIPDHIIKSLIAALKDESIQVRETAVGILGRIGLPEAMIALGDILALIHK